MKRKLRYRVFAAIGGALLAGILTGSALAAATNFVYLSRGADQTFYVYPSGDILCNGLPTSWNHGSAVRTYNALSSNTINVTFWDVWGGNRADWVWGASWLVDNYGNTTPYSGNIGTNFTTDVTIWPYKNLQYATNNNPYIYQYFGKPPSGGIGPGLQCSPTSYLVIVGAQ